MPDALSKTVPIWIAVLNRLLFPNYQDHHPLQTPPTVVSGLEHAQIALRIDGFVEDARKLSLDIDKFKTTLRKPLQPIWLTPATDLQAIRINDRRCWPVVLCTASSCDSVERSTDRAYVQGAADDHESWAHGLSAVTFWQHQGLLLNTPESDIDAEISHIVQMAAQQIVDRPRTLIQPTSGLFISNNASALSESGDIDVLVYCSERHDLLLEDAFARCGRMCIHLVCSEGKNGSRQLRAQVEKLQAVAKISNITKIMCTCPTGRDLAVGVALTLLCRYFADDGNLDRLSTSAISKATIKQKLSWIMVSMPDAAPSRATLQSVNSILMS